MTYTFVKVDKTKYKKYFGVNNKTGALILKKGLPKGTYKVAVKVKAAGDANYIASKQKSVSFKITVK